jgi:predicted small metal-binding protein
MAYQLSCADAGADCKFTVTTEKKDELLQHVQLHMKASHPEMLKNPPPPDEVAKLIREV